MKKSIFVRLTALLLVVLMATAILVSCGKTTTAPKTGDDDTDTDTDTDTDVPADLRFDEDGAPTVMRFLVADDTNLTYDTAKRSIEVAEEDKEKNGVNSAIYERNTVIENQLGVDIVMDKEVYISNIDEETEEMLAGGIHYYDIIGGFLYYASGLAIGQNAGNYLNYNKIVGSEGCYLNLDREYWDKDITSTMSYAGASYWITGDASLYYTGGTYVTYVNAKLWDNYKTKIQEITGYTNVYDVVNNGKWTIDNMCKIAKECWIDNNNNEKVDKEDQAGYISIDYYDLKAMAGGFHYNFTKWVDGKPQLDIKKDMTYGYYEKVHNLLDNCNTYIYDDFDFYNQTTPYVMTLFARGNFLFCIDNLFNSEKYLYDMEDDYYVIPCPLYDEEQFKTYGYSSSLYDGTTLFMIPYTIEDLACVSATLQLMAEKSYEIVTPAYYETALKTRYVRGDVNAAAQTIDLIRDGLYYDFIYLYCVQVNSISDWVTGGMIGQNNKSVMSAIEAKSKITNKALESFLERLEMSKNVEK